MGPEDREDEQTDSRSDEQRAEDEARVQPGPESRARRAEQENQHDD